MEYLTIKQTEQLEQAIVDINAGIEVVEVPDAYNIEIPEATPVEQKEIDNIVYAHKVKIAFDRWVNQELRPDWLIGELTRVF